MSFAVSRRILGTLEPATRSAPPDETTGWSLSRLSASARPNRIFEAVQTVVAETGMLKARTRRALDSTILDDAVARQDTVTQLIAAVRRVGRDVSGGQELILEVCTGYDYGQAGKPRIAWDDPAARDQLVSALVTDAKALLASIDSDGLDGRAAEAVAMLALVSGQDVEPAEGSDGTDGRWRIARKVAPDRVISTVDPEARHAHKTQSRQQDGFKADVVIEPDMGIFTATELTKAAGPEYSDAAVGAGLLARDETIAGQNVEVLADSAYGTGEMLAPVSKPWPLRPAVEGGFTLDDFTVDEDAGTVTCPAGNTRPISKYRRVSFKAACRGCPLRSRCTTARDGRNPTLHPFDRLQREHRERAADQEFRQSYRQHRPMVERSIAWLTRGARRVPYRGVGRNNAWLSLRAAGLNLRRLLNLGLANSDGTWAIA